MREFKQREAALMTVSVQQPFTASVASGASTVFPYGFKIAHADDLSVMIDGVLQSSGYSVTGVGDDAGGDVVFDVAPEAGAKVLRYLNPQLKRETDYQQFGDWMATVVNLDFDRLWLAMQMLAQNTSRSLKLPVDTATNQEITADAAARANKGIKFDGDGNLVVANYDPDAAQESAQDAVLSAQAAAAVAEAAVEAFGGGGILDVQYGGTGASTVSAARSSLGLGALATLDEVGLSEIDSAVYGTSGANKLLQLDSSGKLPALSGENLTDLPIPAVTHDGEFRSAQVFTTTGANTYTKPAGLKRVKVTVVGAGGGGGGCASGGANASGGGGGGASIKYIEASAIGTTETVTIGAGGTAGTTGGSAGGTGGTSSFGTHCSATGGAGGNGTISGATLFELGGAGGTGASGTFNARGQPGRGGTTNYSGVGGSSIFGGAGTAVQNAGGIAGFTNSGGGGSGANNLALTTGRAGGVGGTGVVIVEEFF